MYSLGIMQGRLTPSESRGIQFFPFENWENEFRIAREIGFDEIEFIFDYDNYEQNPLWTNGGIKRINRIIGETNIDVNSICIDYFMRRPFFKGDNAGLKAENQRVISRVISSALDIGAKMIMLPLVDGSSIKSPKEKAGVIDFVSELADKSGITISVETDFSTADFNSFVKDIARNNVKINYDSGDRAGLGYGMYEEITALNDKIARVHIKDKEHGGVTTPLGTGSVDFNALLKCLNEINYSGSFILQAARGEDGKEAKTVKSQLDFLRQYINIYYNVSNCE